MPSPDFKPIVLKLDGSRIPSDKFVQAVDSFYGLIASVSRAVPGGEKLSWNANVEAGSIQLSATPEPSTHNIEAAIAVKEAVVDGLSMLEQEKVRPEYFDDGALRKVYDLASVIADMDDEGISVVRVRHGDELKDISHQAVAHVNDLLGSRSSAHGSVEGRLQTLSERGELRFVVYDPLTDAPIKCLFSHELIEDVAKSFGRRVLVYGLIRYREDGTPNSVRVEHFEVFPSSEDLPSAQDVKGVLGVPEYE